LGKRIFDIVLSLIALIPLSAVIFLFWFIVRFTSAGGGFYKQIRVGRFGSNFIIYKIRSMDAAGKVTRIGGFIRKYKIDELPQLYNILKGEMSFVGPRPDIPGYYDRLTGNNRCLLNLRPGLTGPASIKYAAEEYLLQNVENPQQYNDEVIFPDKVRLNLIYYNNQSLLMDIKLIICTLTGKLPKLYF